MSKNRIPFTAQLSSIIKSEDDFRYKYFVTRKAKVFHKFISLFLHKRKLEKIFNWRINISKEFDKKIYSQNPNQILELGCGYSLRGFDLATKNKNIIYVDSDIREVVKFKKKILSQICSKEGILMPLNYHLITLDVLDKKQYNKVMQHLKKTKPTIVVCEGVLSYFNRKDFDIIISNIKYCMQNFKKSYFFSHEPIKSKNSKLIAMVKKTIGIRNVSRFKNSQEIKSYLHNNFKVLDVYQKLNNIFYLVKR